MNPFDALVQMQQFKERYGVGGDMTRWFDMFARRVVNSTVDKVPVSLFATRSSSHAYVDDELPFSEDERNLSSQFLKVFRTVPEIGEIFICKPNMCELISGIWESMPEQTLNSTDPPSDAGVVFFEKPLPMQRDDHELECHGLTWSSAISHHTLQGLHQNFLISSENTSSKYLELGRGLWVGFLTKSKSPKLFEYLKSVTSRTPSQIRQTLSRYPEYILFDLRMQEFGKVPLISKRSVFGGIANIRHPQITMLQVFFTLCRQELPAVERYEPSQRELKAMRRMDLRNRQISIIMLRRRAGTGHSDTEVEWSHRWIVRGHWRNQWYRTTQEHRLIYINPHIKGPENKPLVVHDKVNILGR